MTRRGRKREKMVHVCGQPLCNAIVPVSERFCPVHQAQHEAEWQAKKDDYRRSKLGQAIKANKAKQYDMDKRDPEATKFYHSKQWQKVRDAVYSRDLATCQVCGNVVTDRKIVDHIVPLRLCTAKQALSSADLWTLCYRCHFRKTKLEQLISAKPGGDNILRHLDKQWWIKVLREKKEEK